MIRAPYAAIGNGVRFRRETITRDRSGGAPRDHRRRHPLGGQPRGGPRGGTTTWRRLPGLAEAGHEFYSIAGANAVREILPTFRSGRAVIGICGTPYKCPPAPSEAALLLDDHLRAMGVREAVEITVVSPFGIPAPAVARDVRPRSWPWFAG